MTSRACAPCGGALVDVRGWTRHREAHRATPAQRGYGAAHKQAREYLAATLPAPCGYCHVVVQAGERFDAAHVVDGEPHAGWMVAHPTCNQRAKVRGGGRGAVGSRKGGSPGVTRRPDTHTYNAGGSR